MSAIRWRYRHRRLWVTPRSSWSLRAACPGFPVLDQEFAAEWAKEFDSPPWRFDAGATSCVLSAVLSGTIAFTGFVFTVVLLSVQLHQRVLRAADLAVRPGCVAAGVPTALIKNCGVADTTASHWHLENDRDRAS